MDRVRFAAKRVVVFTDKYPLLGPIFWMLSIQYLITTYIVAQAWPKSYDWKNNFISDLGNTVCGQFAGAYVCSPLHAVMNVSFIVFGITIAIGSMLIYREFKRTEWSRVGFMLMSLAGFGTMFVGVFPENSLHIAHTTGALLGLGVGNLSIVILALALRETGQIFRFYSFMSGVVALAAFTLFFMHLYFDLGKGGMERVVSYMFTIWMITFGLYMSAVRVRARRQRGE